MSDFIEEQLSQLTWHQETLTMGPTHWFEGEISFAEVVRTLQDAGTIQKSPYTLPLPYLSVSQVEQYLKCAKQFYFRYVLGQRKPPSVALVQGSTIHKAVEHGYLHVIQNKALPPLEYCLDTYSSELDTNLTEEVTWDDAEDEETPRDKGKVKDQGVSLVKAWHKNKLPKVSPRAVEKSFITTIAGIPLVGRIDLVDRTEEALNPDAHPESMNPRLDVIVDNKVVGKTYSKAMVDNKLQLSIYAGVTGVPRQRLDLFVKTKTPRLSELLTSRDSKQVRWAVKVFLETARAISAGVFPMCSPDSWACSPRFCGYYSSCRGSV